MNQHSFWQRKTMYKPYCRKCGLLWLNNQATAKAIRRECPYKDED